MDPENKTLIYVMKTEIHYYYPGFACDNVYLEFKDVNILLPEIIIPTDNIVFGIKISGNKKIKELRKVVDYIYRIEYEPCHLNIGDTLPNGEIIRSKGNPDMYGVTIYNEHYGMIEEI